MSDDEQTLWRRYRAAQTDVTRNALVVHYTPFVEHIARRVAKRAPDCVNASDLTQEGHIALLFCIGRFDPRKGVPFTSYSGRRVEGAMLDWMRGEDLLPDMVRRTVTAHREQISTSQHTGHRTTQDIADDLGITPKQVETAVNGTAGFLYDLARFRGADYESSRASQFMLVTLDWCGLHAVQHPGQWFPVGIEDVLDFGPIQSVEAEDRPTIFAERIFAELRLSPRRAYEWHLASIAEDSIPQTLPERRTVTMTDFLERINTKISRKRRELERLEEMRACISDPYIADDLAEILDTTPVPRKRKTQTPKSKVSAVTKTIISHFRRTGNTAASVDEISVATGLTAPQVRGAVASKRVKRFEKSDAASNGVIRYVMVSG